jgi:lipopolysaccharide/colanic/teichoic acid biosynthesis glycosyltransferase
MSAPLYAPLRTPEAPRRVAHSLVAPAGGAVISTWRTPTRYERLFKPALDRVAAALLLALASPLLLLAVVAIRVSLGPGVLFRQRRVGQGGRLFTVYKFRSMLHPHQVQGRSHDHSCPRCGGLSHKCPADPRHTPLGRLLRKLSIDELPQLFNILRGEMSLVGPRPELPEIVARYQPWQHDRHLVKPGMTGLWQVTERGTGKLMWQSTGPDIDYVRRISLATDLSILARTFPAMLGSHSGH